MRGRPVAAATRGLFTVNTLPEIDAALTDPAASYWFQEALRAALVRDPIDAANDAARLSSLLEARANAALFGATAPRGER